jgi:hypothetical protein
MTFPLIVVMLVLIMTQSSWQNKITGFCYLVSVIYVNYYMIFMPEYYFLLSALFEGTGICLVLNAVQSYTNNLASKLQAMCLILVAIQFAFYSLWYQGIEIIGNYAIESFYSLTWTAYYWVVCAILVGSSGSFGSAIKYFRFYSSCNGVYKRNTRTP